MLRYGVSHPVINDRNMVLWRDLGVASWPTLMVVSPKGNVIATLAGAALLHSVASLQNGIRPYVIDSLKACNRAHLLHSSWVAGCPLGEQHSMACDLV